MDFAIIGLLVFALLLLLLSFFKKDRLSKIEEEMEQMTLTHMQDIYQLKRKIKLLEEELLIQDAPSANRKSFRPASVSVSVKKPAINEILKSQVLSLYHQGLPLEQIEKQSALSMEEILTVIEDQQTRGFSS
ncbi:hypothetical protein D0469_18980 [Peribacillus saganii]|uniref:Uncharacterized protein n=1 Tax=Peribacillus saganii TaxID=2303992 RepID=A0A372LDS7_9BACI|nr:hypothetical protein [Peribacillus saganii]RFU64288.1 hypothetical protein D0469_18980 [Peribacillus saganii]